MKRTSVAIGLVMLLAAIALASDNLKVKGWVIDNMCAARAKGDNAVEKVKGHPTKCALMPNCTKAGYALLTEDGKWYKLDEAGNQKVVQLLKDTKSEKGLNVAVEGTADGDTLKVVKVSEVQSSTQ